MSVAISGFHIVSLNFLFVFILSFLLICLTRNFIDLHKLIKLFSILIYYCIGIVLIPFLMNKELTQISGVFLDRNYFAGFFGLCLISLFIVIVNHKKLDLKKIYHLSLLTLGIFCFFQLQSRTPFYALTFLLILYIIYKKPKMSFLVITILIFLLFTNFYQSNFSFEYRLLGGGQNALLSNNTRLALTEIAIDLFLENPLFGVGPNLFREHCIMKYPFYAAKYNLQDPNSGLVAHSSYLQGLSELGIFFFISLCFQMSFSTIILFIKKQWIGIVFVLYIFMISATMEYLASPVFLAVLFANLFFVKSDKKGSHDIRTISRN